MQDILKGVEILSAFELERAEISKGKTFLDQHQASAVLYEEIQEVQEELDRVNQRMKGVWGCTRADTYPKESIQLLRHHAKLLAAEAIQVVAMSQKFINSFEEG